MADKKKEVDKEWEFLNSPIVLLLIGAGMIGAFYYIASPYRDCIRLMQSTYYDKPLYGAKEICLKWTNW